jgi:hypothetical protein
MRKYLLHVPGTQTLQTFTFRLLKGKQRTLFILQHFSDISHRVYHTNFVTRLPLPINCQTSHCIYSRCCILFFARVWVLRQYWGISYVTWRIFSCGAFPHILQSPFPSLVSPHTLAIAFLHLSSRAKPGTPASYIYWAVSFSCMCKVSKGISRTW